MNLQFSPQFLESLESILQYYEQRNGNNSYSRKLLRQILRLLNLLTTMPDIGCQTDHQGIRMLFVGDYVIDYEKIGNDILIIDIYSCQTNPALRKYKKK